MPRTDGLTEAPAQRPVRARKPAAAPAPAPASAEDVPFVETVDTSSLDVLLGYNARRAALAVIEVFLRRMQPYGLRPVDFSVMSLVTHNPGITSRQLCTTLGILPPNLVNLVATLEQRGLIERKPHPRDRRATGLHPTPDGRTLMAEAEQTAIALEAEAASRLTTTELRTLMKLLRKVYAGDGA